MFFVCVCVCITNSHSGISGETVCLHRLCVGCVCVLCSQQKKDAYRGRGMFDSRYDALKPDII